MQAGVPLNTKTSCSVGEHMCIGMERHLFLIPRNMTETKSINCSINKRLNSGFGTAKRREEREHVNVRERRRARVCTLRQRGRRGQKNDVVVEGKKGLRCGCRKARARVQTPNDLSAAWVVWTWRWLIPRRACARSLALHDWRRRRDGRS